jgi:hypothetical protein
MDGWHLPCRTRLSRKLINYIIQGSSTSAKQVKPDLKIALKPGVPGLGYLGTKIDLVYT